MTVPRNIPWRMLVMATLVIVGVLLAGWQIKGFMTRNPQIPQEIKALQESQPDLVGVLLPTPRELKPFTLTDHEERAFTLDQLKGQWTFLFFGYTHCPDVCPVSMGALAEVWTLLQSTSNGLKNVRGVFVSVDPDRDTLPHLKEYVGYFHPDFLGVTGTHETIRGFAKQLGAYYSLPEKKEGSDSSEQTISHTSVFFLLDPEGRFAAMFQPQMHMPARVAELFVKIRQFYGEKP
nr:Electron transport protein SCO1/SenC [uncultured bacterium]